MGKWKAEMVRLQDEGKAPWQLDPLHPDNWIIDGPPEDVCDLPKIGCNEEKKEDVTDECPF